MEEIWKDLPGFPGFTISNKGEVRGITGVKIKSNNGRFINLMSNGKKLKRSVPSLVYSTFIKEVPFGALIKHKDGDRTNFDAENLYTIADRDAQIKSDFNDGKMCVLEISAKHQVAARTIRLLLGISQKKPPKQQKEILLPKENSLGKFAIQNGENKIPYADNCTVKPKNYNHEAYLIRQFTYNY